MSKGIELTSEVLDTTITELLLVYDIIKTHPFYLIDVHTPRMERIEAAVNTWLAVAEEVYGTPPKP